jgi:hypothetical protein
MLHEFGIIHRLNLLINVIYNYDSSQRQVGGMEEVFTGLKILVFTFSPTNLRIEVNSVEQ